MHLKCYTCFTVRLSVCRWYLKDTNAIPTEYVLQRVSSRVPDFNSQLQDRQIAARVEWWKDFTDLQKIIKKGAKKGLKDSDQVHHYIMSGEYCQCNILIRHQFPIHIRAYTNRLPAKGF